MIPLDQAQEAVLSRCRRLGAVRLPTGEARMLVSAERVAAAEQVPAFDNSAMDGYAVRAEDTSPAPARLRILGTLAAGDFPREALSAGGAMRIMTGAALPPGADAVVMVERTRESPDGEWVTLDVSVPAGNHIRRAGEDMQPGQVVFESGCLLRPAHLGTLAGLGVATVSATRRARVGVMSTGDELVAGPAALAPGQIRDSNRLSLLSLVAESGAEPVDLGLARDDAEEIREMITRGSQTCDAVITSGGVSMGSFDLVKSVLDEMGAMSWMQVAIRPAKPLAFGLVDDVPVFGLPGNTVSCMVSFELFARPALMKMMGRQSLHRQRLAALACEPLRRWPDGKTHFARVVWRYVDGVYEVRSAGGQGSHQLSAMAAANGLAVLPDGDGVDTGEPVELICLGE